VARAWTDPGFRARLLDDGITAAEELGAFTGGFPARGGVSGASQTLVLNAFVTLPSRRSTTACHYRDAINAAYPATLCSPQTPDSPAAAAAA